MIKQPVKYPYDCLVFSLVLIVIAFALLFQSRDVIFDLIKGVWPW
jgi:hypothetical protein